MKVPHAADYAVFIAYLESVRDEIDRALPALRRLQALGDRGIFDASGHMMHNHSAPPPKPPVETLADKARKFLVNGPLTTREIINKFVEAGYMDEQKAKGAYNKVYNTLLKRLSVARPDIKKVGERWALVEYQGS